MKNTYEQHKFFEWVEFGQGNAILESVAGSGKTTSIVEALNYIDDTEPVLAVSFTKLAATELQTRIKAQKFSNVQATTLNSLGWGVCKANVRGVELDANKTLNILSALLEQPHILRKLGLTNGPEFVGKVKHKLKGCVRRAVGLLKAYVVDPTEVQNRLDGICEYHSLDLPEGESDEAKTARSIFNQVVELVYLRGIEVMNYMDFDDQKFMPVYYQWSFPSFKWIFIDEAQDCNHCDIEMVHLLHQSNENARSIWVGDAWQAIYLFRGALNNALEVIKKQFNCHYMTLSVCWRCASDLLIEPAKLNPLIKGPNDNPKGKGVTREVETKEFIENVKVGDYVLCRTTAPLIKRCIQLVQRGTPANVKGREIGDQLVDLVNKIIENMGPLFKSGEDPETLLKFIEAVNNYRVERVAVLEAANRDEAALRVNDECEGLLNFCTEARNVDSVVNHIRNVFADVDDDSKIVLFLTGHKSKGLQNPRVWFLRPDLSPHPMAKKAHEIDQEMHLRYVITTRAEREFYYVRKEKDEK